MNEFLLIASLFVIYGTVLLAYRIFGLHGLYCFTAIATITANIEVLIMVNAFGMEQTLGNILFASTFLVTDIISEVEGKKASQKAVNIGIFTSIFFIIVSQTWMLYQPSASDWAQPAIKTIFSNTPTTVDTPIPRNRRSISHGSLFLIPTVIGSSRSDSSERPASLA